MVSITACSTSRLERCWLLLLAWFVLAGGALAAEIEVANPRLLAGEDGYVLAADFNFDFNPRLEEAVAKGVALHFVVEFELTRPRWYWFDEKLVSRSLTYRLSYHALTRQYRLATGALHQSFDTLSEALSILARLRHWVVIDKPGDRNDRSLAKAGESYLAAVRLRLDINQLPKPFQIAALANKDWNLASDWKSWALVLPPLPTAVETK